MTEDVSHRNVTGKADILVGHPTTEECRLQGEHARKYFNGGTMMKTLTTSAVSASLDDHSSGKRQFQADITFFAPSNEESVH